MVGTGDVLERLRVRVDITREEGSFVGALQVDDAAGGRVERELADPSCSALMQALSLVVALSTDESAPASRALEAQRAPVAAGAEWGAAPDPFADEPVEPALPSRSDSIAIGPLLFASLQSALAPDPLLGVGLGAAFESQPNELWSPRFELSGTRFVGPDATLSSGQLLARFEAWVASASYCPLRLGAGPWSLRPCLDIEAGRLSVSGRGRGVIRAQERHAPWATSGLSVRAAVAPFGGPVELATTLGGFLPLFRHEFYFAPDIEAFEAPTLGWRASARAAVAF